jgi:hypothetical protein
VVDPLPPPVLVPTVETLAELAQALSAKTVNDAMKRFLMGSPSKGTQPRGCVRHLNAVSPSAV